MVEPNQIIHLDPQWVYTFSWVSCHAIQPDPDPPPLRRLFQLLVKQKAEVQHLHRSTEITSTRRFDVGTWGAPQGLKASPSPFTSSSSTEMARFIERSAQKVVDQPLGLPTCRSGQFMNSKG